MISTPCLKKVLSTLVHVYDGGSLSIVVNIVVNFFWCQSFLLEMLEARFTRASIFGIRLLVYHSGMKHWNTENWHINMLKFACAISYRHIIQ